MCKKILAVLLSVIIAFSVFTVPASAIDFSVIKIENVFFQCVDVLIHQILNVLNIFWPGYDDSWDNQESYITENFYSGEDEFITTADKKSKWSLGYSGASLLDGMDIMNGKFYLAGSLEVFKGRVPTTIYDDQRVRVYAISDNSSGIAVQAVIDGFGISRGDVQEIRSRLEVFAKESGYNIISVDVSALHQHSCIDTLGMNIPLAPALILNTLNAAFGDRFGFLKIVKNQDFMNNLFDKTVACMEDAIKNMKEGELYYGTADISEYIRDARDPQIFDSNLHRLRFIPNDKSAETWILQGSMHATSLGAGPDELTADYPYYIEKAINEKVGANVVYVIGAELAIKMQRDSIYDEDASDIENVKMYGYALAEKAMAVDNEIRLDPVMNVVHSEVFLQVDNGILTLAAREDVLNAVILKNGRDYIMVTEIGYMELGNKVGIFMCPGEFDPSLIFGGEASGEAAWLGQSWDYDGLQEYANVENVMVYGLCNDQAGYVLRDNEYHSLLSENEEVNVISRTAASTFVESYIDLFESVK